MMIGILVLSILLNVFLVWYIREVIVRFISFRDESANLTQLVDSYLEHISSVYELPMFYGDSTIQGLMSHTSNLKEELQILKQIFDFDSPVEEETHEEEEG